MTSINIINSNSNINGNDNTNTNKRANILGSNYKPHVLLKNQKNINFNQKALLSTVVTRKNETRSQLLSINTSNFDLSPKKLVDQAVKNRPLDKISLNKSHQDQD